MSTVPRQLKYGSKVESAMAKSYRSNIAPQNGTGPYALGNTISLNIPTRNNLVLVPPESYLKFDVAVTNGATANNPVRWDSCGAHGLIQRIRIWHGSNLIEDQDNYGLLAKMLFDLQVSQDASYGKYNILAGTRNDTITKTAIATADGTDLATTQALANALKANLNAGNSGLQVNSGASLGTLGANAVSATQTYCLNLISIIGSLCGSNYLPLFAATSAPLRVEIQLVSDATNCLASTTAIAGST